MHHVPSRRTRAAVLGAVTLLALAGCGGHSGTSHSGAAASPASSVSISSEHNDADVTFIRDMTPHHEGAVEMAKLAPTRAANAEVKALAAAIEGAQEPELAQMAAMAKAWGVDLAGGSAHGGTHMGGDDAEALEPLTGAAFDKEFLTRMIAHHEGAIPMSKAVLAEGKNPQAAELAKAIISVQEKEIATMTGLLSKV